ncbi:MAG: ABC transporter permease [Defluviicoccus sp.]|nr:ABC transporter permease [Defluviicoccus sp.]MDE0385644.1 ABC transporter permease [Defluviicoccus sp.]
MTARGRVLATARAPTPARETWARLLRNGSAISGLALLALVLGTTFIAPGFYPADPFDIAWRPLAPPGEAPAVPLGSDFLGRDVLAGIVHGGRATLVVGASAAAICMIIGIAVGAASGFYGGLVDEGLMRIAEFFQVLPALLFAMTLVSLFGPDFLTIILAIGAVSWPPIARLARAEFLRIRELDYVRASRAIGASDLRLIWRVILPNALPSLIVAATLAVGAAILFEAGLAFLGLGDPNVVSWGLMIGANRDFVLEAWWTVTLPGLAIFLTVLGVSLIGDGLTDALDPRRHGR